MKKNFTVLFFLLFSLVFSPFSQTSDPEASISRDIPVIDENGGSAEIKVSLSTAATADIDVTITFTGTADINDDYTITNNTSSGTPNIIRIKAGDSEGTITINTVNDSDVELDEQIIAEIFAISSGTVVAPSTAKVKIKDDDLFLSFVKVDAPFDVDTLYEETQNELAFRIELNEPAPEDISVTISGSGDGFQSSDVALNSTRVIRQGTDFEAFKIKASDDAYFEALAESFYLKISSITSGTGKIVEEDSINLIIKDNDPSYVDFHVVKNTDTDADGIPDRAVIPEKNGETILTAYLQRPFDKEIKLGIDYKRPQSTATFEVDWESDKGDLVTIPVGDTLVQIKISSIDDPDEDPNESLYIYLNNTDGSDTPPSVNITFGAPVLVRIDIEDDEIGPVAGDDDYTSQCVIEGNTNISNPGNNLISVADKTLDVNASDGLLENDTEDQGEALRVNPIPVSYPSHGTVYCGAIENQICPDGSFRYVHDGTETLGNQDKFSYEVLDEQDFSDVGIVTICVTPDNDCPEFDGFLQKVNEFDVENIDLYDYTTDLEERAGLDPILKYRIISQKKSNGTSPAYGVATVTEEGKLTYTAAGFLSGVQPKTDIIEIEVEDGAGCTATDIIKFQINNTAPQAINDTFVVSVGQRIDISDVMGLLANDPTFAGATITASKVDDPIHAITSGPNGFKLNSDGSFQYKHNGDPVAKEDGFTYKMTIRYANGQIDETEARVVITINDCPVIEKDLYRIWENTNRYTDTVRIPINGINSIDGQPWIGDNDYDINGDEIKYFIEDDPHDSLGSYAEIDSAGNLLYVQGGGEYTQEFFVYRGTDPYCESNADTIFFDIMPRNDCPETLLNGYNSLGLTAGASIKDYIDRLPNDKNGNPISIDSVDTDATSGDTLFVYASDGIVWVLNMDEGGTLAIGAPGILNNDTDAENDSLYTKILLEADHPISLYPHYYNDDGSFKYPYPPHAVDVDVNKDGSFSYEHDGSNGLRDVIYTLTCDYPKLSIMDPKNTDCCSVDSIMLIFGPDNACGEGLPDYYTLNEDGTFTADKTTTGINEYMLNKTGTEYTGVFSNDFDEEGDSLVFLGISSPPAHGIIVGDTIYPDGSFTYIHDGFRETTADQFTYDMTDLPHSPNACATVTVYLNIIEAEDCPEPINHIYEVDEGETLIVSGLANGSEGSYLKLPGIMGGGLDAANIDVDLGTYPTISEDLIAYYPFNEYYDSIPGIPADDGDGGKIPTMLAVKKAKDLGPNNFDGFLRGGTLDTISAPQPSVPDPKGVSPVIALEWSNPPQYQRDRFRRQLNSYQYDGSESYVEVEDDILNLKRDYYSISGWFYVFDPAIDGNFLNFTIDGKEKGLILGIKGGKLALGIGNGDAYSVRLLSAVSSDDMIAREWYHFTLIKNKNNYKIFLNREEIYSDDLDNSSLPNKSSKMFIGKSLAGNNFFGRFDDLHIIGDTISQDDILKLYYSLSTSLEGQAEWGDVDVGVDGSFTYVHNGVGGQPEDQFIYGLSDGPCEEINRVKIIVKQVNDCPIAVNDTFNVDEGGTLSVDALNGILINDTDEENDPLNAAVVDTALTGLPVNGTIKINTDGSFEYIHDGSETLEDSIRYVAFDNDINCTDTATIFITINPVADCPIPEDDIYVVKEGGELVIGDECITVYDENGTGYENWEDNEPNDLPLEDYGEMYASGTWNDITTTPRKRYLLEMESGVNSVTDHQPLSSGFSYNGHTYFISNREFDWETARTEAEDAGGYLAIITSQAENDAISSLLTETVFIGLYQDPADQYFKPKFGGWKWVDGTYLYDEGNSYQFCGVLSNDDRGGGDSIYVSYHGSPSHGTLDGGIVEREGTFTYTHDGSQNSDTILYRIRNLFIDVTDNADGTKNYNILDSCESDYGRIIINIENINDCPVAVRDTFYVDEGGSLDTTGVLLNDYDDDGDLLRAVKEPSSNFENGDGNVFADGRLVYTHRGEEVFMDSIQYRVLDLDNCDSLGTAIIIINPVNDLPVAEKDSFEVNEGGTLVVDVANGLLSNDTDAENDKLTTFITKLPTVGNLTCPSTNASGICADGSFTYEHDGSDDPNEVCFTYVTYDGVGFSQPTEVCIKILNRVPDCPDIIEYSVNEDEVLTTDLSNGILENYCQDPDPQDVMRVIPDSLHASLTGAFVLNDDGTFVYDHDCSDDPNETWFTYFVTDGEDTTQVADTVKINILNECPIGNDDLYSGVSEGDVLTIDPSNGVASNDEEKNQCDILEITLLQNSGPLFGDLDLKSDGSFTYEHDDSENFTDEFKYLLNDGECLVPDTVTVTIRIEPVPDTPPVAVEDSFDCIDEGDSLIIAFRDDGILYNDYDDDPGQTQTLRSLLVKRPLHAKQFILNTDGTFIYKHDGGESTTDSFTYFVTDDNNLNSDTVTVKLCINPVNDCPVPIDDIFNINESDVIDSTLIFNDFDVEGNELLVNVINNPSIGGFNWNQDGTFIYTAPDDIQAPGPEIITFEYTLSDIDDAFLNCNDTATVTIIINYENDCPITEDDSIIVDGTVASSRIINILDNDSDPDSDIDTTSVKIISGPTFGNAISNIDGTITYNFDESPIPFDTITYSVSDYEGCEVLGKVYIYVDNLRNPIYNLPNYFTPNGDDFNDFFLIKYENILREDLSFEVKIFDRYQRMVYEGVVESSDKIWNGMSSFTSEIVKTDFYFYEITPVEYYNTPYVRRRDKILGTVYLEKER